MPFIFDPVLRAAFEGDGFLLVPSLFNADEIAMHRSDQSCIRPDIYAISPR
jgi:hypothetical protein